MFSILKEDETKKYKEFWIHVESLVITIFLFSTNINIRGNIVYELIFNQTASSDKLKWWEEIDDQMYSK